MPKIPRISRRERSLEVALGAVTQANERLESSLAESARYGAMMQSENRSLAADCRRLHRQVEKYASAPPETNSERAKEVLEQTIKDWHAAERRALMAEKALADLSATVNPETMALRPVIDEGWVRPVDPKPRAVVAWRGPTKETLAAVSAAKAKETV